MALALVQSNAVATSVNGATNIAATLSSPSTFGNLLLLSVATGGGAPTITTPAGWTLIASVVTGTIALDLFMLPANPGGIQTIAGGVTISNTNGGGVASMFEFSGVSSASLDQSNTQNGTSAAPLQLVLSGVATQNNELFFAVFAHTTAFSLTSANLTNFSADTASGTSTVATNNVVLHNFWGQNFLNAPNPAMAGNGTLTGSTAWRNLMVRLFGGPTIINNNVSGNPGLLVASGAPAPSATPNSNANGYGGEVPGPIGSGSFFSGMIGG